MLHHNQKSCGFGTINSPTIIHENNATCVAQMEIGYINSDDMTKHIYPKYSILKNSRMRE